MIAPTTLLENAQRYINTHDLTDVALKLADLMEENQYLRETIRNAVSALSVHAAKLTQRKEPNQ